MALTVQNSSPTLSMAGRVYWIGNDGNVWLHNADGSATNLGAAQGTGTTANLVLNGAKEIANPGNPGGQTLGATTVADAAPSAADLKAAQDAADRAKFRGEIKGKQSDVDRIYAALFGDLDTLLKSRDQELETQYGGQFKQAADKYAEAIPQIETSYAAIGAGDSTDNTYAKVGAKKGFESTNETIGQNKAADKAKLGQFGNEQRAKFSADQASANRNIARADETTDVDALRSMRNDLETNLDTAGVTRASLGTDAGARGQLSALTADNGRADAAINALDEIMKSSLGGDVKKAAVEAVTTSSGLTDEEKKKVQAQFGNVYAEQAAL